MTHGKNNDSPADDLPAVQVSKSRTTTRPAATKSTDGHSPARQNAQDDDWEFRQAEAAAFGSLPKRPKCKTCGKRRRPRAWGRWYRTSLAAGGSHFEMICVDCVVRPALVSLARDVKK